MRSGRKRARADAEAEQQQSGVKEDVWRKRGRHCYDYTSWTLQDNWNIVSNGLPTTGARYGIVFPSRLVVTVRPSGDGFAADFAPDAHPLTAAELPKELNMFLLDVLRKDMPEETLHGNGLHANLLWCVRSTRTVYRFDPYYSAHFEQSRALHAAVDAACVRRILPAGWTYVPCIPEGVPFGPQMLDLSTVRPESKCSIEQFCSPWVFVMAMALIDGQRGGAPLDLQSALLRVLGALGLGSPPKTLAAARRAAAAYYAAIRRVLLG